MSPSLRIVFMGTAELACASLRALSAAPGCSVVLVVTQPDKPRGRELRLQPTPVKAAAEALGLPVVQPERARAPEFIAGLRDLRPDLIVVAAYGQLLPPELLAVPPHGCLNVHTSILPKYRGAAPIQWAIIEGESETGVTIMKMDAGLDTGDILHMARTPIEPADDAGSLHDRLAGLGAQALLEAIPPYVRGELKPRPQPVAGASYARKITKEDGRIDWSLPARSLWCRIRGLTPWPGAYTFLAPGQLRRLIKLGQVEPLAEDHSAAPGTVLRADASGIVVACGAGALRIGQLQREGGRRLSAAEACAGRLLRPGDPLCNE